MTKNEISTQLKDIPFSKVLTEWFKLKDRGLKLIVNLDNISLAETINLYYLFNKLC